MERWGLNVDGEVMVYQRFNNKAQHSMQAHTHFCTHAFQLRSSLPLPPNPLLLPVLLLLLLLFKSVSRSMWR